MMKRKCLLLFLGRQIHEGIKPVNIFAGRSMTYNISGYKWEYMSAKTFPPAIKLMTDYFCVNEPAIKAIGLANNPKALEEFSFYCADTALDGISVVVKDIETDEVIGTGFHKLHTAPESLQQHSNELDYYWTQPESKHFVIDVIAQIKKRLNLFQKYGVDTTMELSLWSVHPNHRNKKIGYILGQVCIDTAKKLHFGPVSEFTAKDLGPDFAAVKQREVTKKAPQLFYSLLTSSKTQTVAKKLGCSSDALISFNDLYYKGKSYSELLGVYDKYNVEIITYLLCKELKRKYNMSH